MFNPNALKYKGFYYNVDAFVMDIGNQFYRECAYYINSLDSTATGIKVALTEKDNLLYSFINKEKEAYAYSIDPSIVGFDLMKNLLSNTNNLNSSLFSMGWFSSMDKEAILHTFSDYKKSVGKSASDLGSKLPLWVKWANFKVLFKDQEYILNSFIDAVIFAVRNVISTCKSGNSELKNMSVDKIMAIIGIPMELLAQLVGEFIGDMGLNHPSVTDYVNLPFICYNLVRWVFSATKDSTDEIHEPILRLTRGVIVLIISRINSEFKQKEVVSKNCILTTQFLISELVSRGFTPAKEIFDNVLKVCTDMKTDDAALFLFANTYLAAEIGTNPAVPYNSIRLVDSEVGKNAADKAMEAQAKLREEKSLNDAKMRKRYECSEAVEEAVAAARAKDAATASASATAKPNTVDVKNDAAATPGVIMTLPPSNTTLLPPAPPSTPATPNPATSGTTESTSSSTTPAAPTPTSTVTPGNVAADRPTGFTPRTRRATGRDKQSDWDGLDPTQLAAYNKQVHSEHVVRSKSNFDDYARSFNPSASLTGHSSAIQPIADFPLSNRRAAPKNSATGRYKSSFGDKEFTTMMYQ